MKSKLPANLEKLRIDHPLYGKPEPGSIQGCFGIPYKHHQLFVISGSGEFWDHISVSLKHRCPTWNEMCFVKNLFFEPDELVIQFHPPEAANIAKRFWGDRKFSDVRVHKKRLMQPLNWRKPRKVFICSMSDMFHEQVPEGFIWHILDIVSKAKKHTFQILTKRPERMQDIMNRFYSHAGKQPHIWLGVTCENQKTADERIPTLLDIPAAVRFVSVEPMLSRVIICPAIDWIICGCESGPKRRPTDIGWIKDLRNQCTGFDIPFFLKQMEIDGRVVKMPKLDGTVWNQYPENFST